MKFLRTASVLVLTAFALTACDDDTTGTTTLDVSDLAGAWNATQFEYTDNANTDFSIDVITDLGGDLNIDVAQSGDFTGGLFVQGVTPDTLPLSGSFSISGDTLSIAFSPTSPAVQAGLVSDLDAAYSLNGNVLTLTNDNVDYDFPNSIEAATPGIEERGEVPATVDITLNR